jgi:hypothetical protein
VRQRDLRVNGDKPMAAMPGESVQARPAEAGKETGRAVLG